MIRPLAATLLASLLSTLAAAQTVAPAQTPKAPAGPEDEKGLALFKAGKFDEALKEFQAAARINPRLQPGRIRLAELLMQANQAQAARMQVEIAAVEDPSHPAILLMNGSLAFSDGRIVDTLLSCRAALSAAENPRWDVDQKKKFIREARLGMAAGFEVQRNWPAAKEQLTAILNEDPKHAGARQRMATATFWLGNPEQAFADLQASYKDDPAQDLPELKMHQLWAARNDENQAEAWLKKAVTTHPKEAKASRVYASWLLDHGRADAAQTYVDAAVKLDPTSREVIALRGLLARYRKDFPAAESAFEELVKNYPNDSFSAWNLALVLVESPDATKKRRAVDLAEATARRDPRVAEGYAVLGWVYFKTGRVNDADRVLVQAAPGGQIRPDTAYFMARVLAEKQKSEEAAKVLKQALEARGPFVYRADAQAFFNELQAKLPKKEEPKK